MSRAVISNRGLRRIELAGFVAQWVLVGWAAWTIIATVALSEPLPVPEVDVASPNVEPASPHIRSDSATTLTAIWQRDLRQRLIEPKPEQKPPPKPPPPRPPVRLPKLLATFVEDGRSWGIFVTSGGSYRVRGEADRVEDFQIVSVGPGTATLQRGGERYTVEVPRAQGAASHTWQRRRPR